MTEKRTTGRASIKPRMETVDLGDESTVDDDQEAPGQTNVDGANTPQGTDDEAPGLPERRAYRVLVSHNEHTVDDVIAVEPDGRTVALVTQGYLEPLG